MATADVSYVPGALTAVAGDQCWALVETPPDSPSVTRIWQQLGQGVAADELLVSLLRDGIGAAPGFTLLVAGPGGQHRLFCRGTVGATVVTGPADGQDQQGAGRATAAQVDGAGLLTWREQVVEQAERIVLGQPPADTALRLPATSGVLLAGCVVVDLTNFAARDTLSYPPEDSSAAEKPRKTIVFFPDTMTMTHPGSLAAQASAAQASATLRPDGQQFPADRGPAGLPAPTMPFAGPAGPPVPPAGPGALAATVVPAALSAPARPADQAGSAGPVGGPAPSGPGAGAGPAPGRPGADAEQDFPWATPPATVTDPPPWPAGPGDFRPAGNYPPGGVPGYPAAGPHLPAPYPGAPSPAGQPWPPAPDGARSDGAWPAGPGAAGGWADPARPEWAGPGGPRTAPQASGVVPPAPMPVRAPGPLGGGPPLNQASPAPAGGLIDAVPWLPGPSAPPPARPVPGNPVPVGPLSAGLAPGGPPGPAPAPAGSIPTNPAPAGPAPVGPVPAGPAPAGPPYQPGAPRAESGSGESGPTVKRDELSELVARTVPPDRIGPVVPALICPSGHVNPPSGAVCRRCGAPLPHDPVPVPRPVLGVLRTSLGDLITLDRGVLMGRNPRTDFAGTEGEERPHVVKLPSADGDISRTHLRVTLDGWHVLVTDLNSTNGTLITLPGRESQQLRPGEPVPIQPGTVVTLADGIDFRYEVAE